MKVIRHVEPQWKGGGRRRGEGEGGGEGREGNNGKGVAAGEGKARAGGKGGGAIIRHYMAAAEPGWANKVLYDSGSRHRQSAWGSVE